MDWHFSPETGSPFWLGQARHLQFDPRSDVKRPEDLKLFPNLASELRTARVEDLIPRGYGETPDVIGVFESGGTTGAPKRVVLLRDWCEQLVSRRLAAMDARGVPRDTNWLVLAPSGPHLVGSQAEQQLVAAAGGIRFTIDLDPRWVKKLIAAGRPEEVEAYADHLIDQAAFVLRSQHIGVLFATPALLERLARRDDLLALVQNNVHVILWGGAHMDADTRHIFRSEVFPGAKVYGSYGNTLMLAAAEERVGLGDDDPCIFDTLALTPYVMFSVVDPSSRSPVPFGERGQVVVSHLSKAFLLPNNAERDLATRIRPPEGQLGDSVADVAPVQVADGEVVIEGVY